MKHIIATPHKMMEDGFNPVPSFPEDVRRLIEAAKSLGYVLNSRNAEEIWERHSDDYCASWLVMDGASDADLVEILLKYAVVLDEPPLEVLPPQGFATWLDYAVDTMDTRQPQLNLLFEEGAAYVDREIMRSAVKAELAYLRKRSGLV